ncbi:MAG TPA: hypothetical protein VD969_11195 [Symbiobacteriaceae bacterium]|nr:hypothetical protein [Symbiobacteriaceae bacterium]
MDAQERLYALALQVVPDVDVAGDMFMDARDEADLLRRAARWRRQQGLPDISTPAFLPRLTPEEREYAHHLARRGRRRRQMRPLSAISAVIMILVLVYVVGFRGMATLGRGLASDPAFAGSQMAAFRSGGLEFAIYKIEATPGAVTFWWAMQGRAASEEDGALELSLTYNGLPTRATLIAQETAVGREDRLVGRSTFRTPLPHANSAGLNVSRHGGVPEWKVAVVIEPTPDAGARTVAVDRSILALSGQVRITVVSVTVGGDYTVIRYHPEGEDFGVALAHQMELLADGRLVERYGTWRRHADSDEREVLFGPLPADAAQLALRFPRLMEGETDQAEIAFNLR